MYTVTIPHVNIKSLELELKTLFNQQHTSHTTIIITIIITINITITVTIIIATAMLVNAIFTISLVFLVPLLPSLVIKHPYNLYTIVLFIRVFFVQSKRQTVIQLYKLNLTLHFND